MGKLDGKVAVTTGGASDDSGFINGAAIAADGGVPDGVFNEALKQKMCSYGAMK